MRKLQSDLSCGTCDSCKCDSCTLSHLTMSRDIDQLLVACDTRDTFHVTLPLKSSFKGSLRAQCNAATAIGFCRLQQRKLSHRNIYFVSLLDKKLRSTFANLLYLFYPIGHLNWLTYSALDFVGCNSGSPLTKQKHVAGVPLTLLMGEATFIK